MVLQCRFEPRRRRGGTRRLGEEVVYLLVVYLEVTDADQVFPRRSDVPTTAVVGGRDIGVAALGTYATKDVSHRESDHPRLIGGASHRVGFPGVGLQ